MADQLLEQARELFEGQIDFEGQRLTEFGATALLAIAGAISFIVGYFRQDIKLALFIGLGGTAVTFLAVVPPWPVFNRRPVKWLSTSSDVDTSDVFVDGNSEG
ncbi:related to microsomal signal peptidase 12 kDa subunit [Phialocephala subalpina]|uniref:Signal peptidase complex subunit 1 n=1 Tax=Phialocephala subalpina TaxID=576137 RepID=A0A1L7X4P9_9HELO|nr:related to microsomal signal peptidase 12 kDa subunit [Phialocephala subalpina]